MKIIYFLPLCLGICTAPYLYAQTSMSSSSTASSSLSMSDQTFIKKAAQGGMTEVQLGQMAADKGSSQAVKDFGSKMVSDHGAANDELKSLASSKGVMLDPKLDDHHQMMVDKMNGLSGPAFDKAYIAAMRKAHKKDDMLFSTEASSGQDSDVKAFAAKTDKVVKMHISMLDNMNM